MENDEKRVSFINTYEEKDRDILEERVQKQIEEIENNEMKKEEDIKNALLNRYNEEEVNRFLILGKDISKRGIPIYKELT